MQEELGKKILQKSVYLGPRVGMGRVHKKKNRTASRQWHTAAEAYIYVYLSPAWPAYIRCTYIYIYIYLYLFGLVRCANMFSAAISLASGHIYMWMYLTCNITQLARMSIDPKIIELTHS